MAVSPRIELRILLWIPHLGTGCFPVFERCLSSDLPVGMPLEDNFVTMDRCQPMTRSILCPGVDFEDHQGPYSLLCSQP